MFKVGDRVIRRGGPNQNFKSGDVGVVHYINDPVCSYDVKLPCGYISQWNHPDYLELYEPEETTVPNKVKELIDQAKFSTANAFGKGYEDCGYIRGYDTILIDSIVVFISPYINYDMVSGYEVRQVIGGTLRIINSNNIENDVDAIYSSIQFFLKEE